ncbi:FHA domain-containing protein [Litorilituus lipolyticus]|uniref:FHA domain-containing protein n=1 Tax=Litorilituus lipolyticus TaxID=2491017 RepID=A0A502KUG0_9GAMM|nr:FHA domain-containing protein [Litorilituus lipolyticus]TPH15192.1 FHA domain-containing protein [Litorilituus lipolyticus]
MEITSINPQQENHSSEELHHDIDDINHSHTDIIIEEISRGQKLLHRHKMSKPSINIGRGYGNDIILADPHICSEHLKIQLVNGFWQIQDQESINGTFLENPKEKKKPADKHILEDGDIISIGKSQLRIHFVDHPVAETVKFSPFESFINLMRHPIALLISVALFTLVSGTIFYLDKPIEVNFSQLLVPAIGMSLLFSLWPAGIALVSHLTKHDARVLTQLGICFAFFNLMWFSDLLENIVAFNSSSNSIFTVLIAILPIALAFCMLWLNCYIGFHMTAKRRMVVSIGITVLLFGGSYLIKYSNKPDFNARPQYNSVLMTPSFLLTPSASVDEFIEDSNRLFDKANKAAAKE